MKSFCNSMSCAGSERVKNSKSFDCRNMGDVLGKECEKKDSSLTRSVDNVLREVEETVSSGPNSERDSEKDLDSDEDLAWLLPVNTMELGAKNCKCEGCLKLFESYNSDKKNAKLLLSSWKEFRNYIRNAYINSPLEAIQKNQDISFEDNERLHEIVQVMRLCDPYQLFQKIEDEVCSMVLESRIRQLNLLKNENNPFLAEEFIAGLIEEYVKLLSSALQLSPAIENLLGPQLQRFGLTWEVLNKQLYRSLVYNHFDVQQNLIRFLEQLRKMLPLKDDVYHELVHQYLALDGEMTLIGTMWKDVEPLIQDYRNLKSKENEKLNNLLDAMKDFFVNKLCPEEEMEEMQNKSACSTSDSAIQCCPNCMTRNSCPCDECTVTHMMSCEDILLVDSPLEENTPSRSRSPSVQNKTETKEKREIEEKQSCECHACTVPPPDLMDCSVAFNQPPSKSNTHGEGFQLYPHIHGTVSEGENVSNLYGSLKTTNESVYSHLYNLHKRNNSDNTSKVNNSLLDQFVRKMMANKTTAKSLQSGSSPPPTPPPPPPQENTPLSKHPPQTLSPKNVALKNTTDSSTEKSDQVAAPRKSVEEKSPNKTLKKNDTEKSKQPGSKNEKKKNDLGNKGVVPKENSVSDKPASEKRQTKLQGNNKTNGCVISGLCGKCCLKHGSNCSKMSGCNKTTDKHLAAIARLNLSGNSTSRTSARHGAVKDDHNHRTGKSHSCNKSKHQENKKSSSRSKKNLEVDDSTSPEDSCSESSNSPSATFQKDPRHCDCCYCEVFGHGVPSVAPVSRNYQEMRERLRLRLNMKKSAKCKTPQPGQAQQQQPQQQPQQPGQKATGGSIKSQPNSLIKSGDAKKEVKEQDLESLIKFIEGKKVECRDAKKAAKRARQKQKKQEEKEKLEEEEEERKRLEAVKRHVTISLVNNPNNNNHNNNNNNNNNRNNISSNSSNKRSQNQAKQTPQVPKSVSQNQKFSQPQTLNLSGLKSLVEKSDPSAVPKMVTIRRVMAPFSAEPTVTITLKGSTPDKDKVLFMLKNGNEALPVEEEEPVIKKSKKKKKKAKQEAEIYEEEPAYEPVPEISSSKKKKKRKNKNSEVTNAESLSSRLQLSKKISETVDSNKNKLKNSKSSAKISTVATSKSCGSGKASQNSTATKPQSQNKSQIVSNSKNNSQKNVAVLKVQDSVNKTNKKDNKSVRSSFSDQLNKNSVSNSKGNAKGVGVSNNMQKRELNNGKTSSSSSSNNNSNNSNQKVKSGKNLTKLVDCEKPVKKQKTELAQSVSRVQNSQTKNKVNELSKHNQKNVKNVYGFPQKLENNQNLEIFPVQDKKDKVSTKTKSNKKSLGNEVEVNWKGPFDRQEGGKLVINTPSYRLSEVLSSIAPSPPPKEEINLENLRLPPGITITKIEGPIQKPVRPPAQVSHTLKPSPPIVMATPTLKPNPPGNVIVVETGRLKEVMKENPQLTVPSTGSTTSKKKKKKNKKQTENEAPAFEAPISQARIANKMPKACTPLNKGAITMLSAMDTRKMAPNLENQQATIIKTSDNMVTIRSPALQQAMNMHAYQTSQNFKPGINGYSNMNLFNEQVNKINDKISKLKLGNASNDRLTKQMKNLSLKEGSRANEILAQVMATASSQNNQTNPKKKKKKKKQKSGEEREVEPVESVFQPKDIDLENGDIDDDERELEAFKRFCLQSVPPERKNKVKVNLNIKDIVLKKKSSVIGCS